MTKRFQPDYPGRYTPDEAARLFVHHLALAISLWEIASEEDSTPIDRAAAHLNNDNYRRALYALIPILDNLYSENPQ